MFSSVRSSFPEDTSFGGYFVCVYVLNSSQRSSMTCLNFCKEWNPMACRMITKWIDMGYGKR